MAMNVEAFLSKISENAAVDIFPIPSVGLNSTGRLGKLTAAVTLSGIK